MVRQWQEIFNDKRYASVELTNPDFIMISKAFQIPAKKVVKRENLKDSLNEMISANGPYLLEIVVQKEGNVFPMVEPGKSVSEIRLTY